MSHVHVEPRRRCACCRVPSNRCPCRACGACTTSGGEPGLGCGCGNIDTSGLRLNELDANEARR